VPYRSTRKAWRHMSGRRRFRLKALSKPMHEEYSYYQYVGSVEHCSKGGRRGERQQDQVDRSRYSHRNSVVGHNLSLVAGSTGDIDAVFLDYDDMVRGDGILSVELCTYHEITARFCEEMLGLMDVTGQRFDELMWVCLKKGCVWHVRVRQGRSSSIDRSKRGVSGVPTSGGE